MDKGQGILGIVLVYSRARVLLKYSRVSVSAKVSAKVFYF